MADETTSTAPPIAAETSTEELPPPPPATSESVTVIEKETPLLPESAAADPESVTSVAVTEEAAPPTAAKEETPVATAVQQSDIQLKVSPAQEEVIESEKPKPLESQASIPESLISFKEESNIVSDLSDFERKVLEELKQLVQEGLNSDLFTSSPSPKPQGEKQSAPSETKPPTIESLISKKTANTHAAKDSEKQSQMGSTEITSSPDEVSIWGVPLLEDERSDVILLKFLRARDFKAREAFRMLVNTFWWRKEFGIESLIDEDLGDDLDKVVFMHGFDKEGHPVCYNVYGEFQNKELYQKTFADEEKRMKFLRWRIQFLERGIRKFDFSPGGICTMFQVSDLKNSPGPGKRELRQATRQALQLLQDNYPEFVAKQVFINVPWWYLAFYTMISPFLTQRTKSKFVFAGPSRTAETLFKYIPPEQVPIQYGGLSVDFCECNPEFSIDDPAAGITVKPATKQTVEILINEKCFIVWELRVVGWEVSYSAEYVPNGEGGYTINIQKTRKMFPTDEPVLSNSFKITELGKILLTIDNPTSKKKKLLYRFKVKPLSA